MSVNELQIERYSKSFENYTKYYDILSLIDKMNNEQKEKYKECQRLLKELKHNMNEELYQSHLQFIINMILNNSDFNPQQIINESLLFHTKFKCIYCCIPF